MVVMVTQIARDYSVETRIRQAIDTHLEAGVIPRTVVVNFQTLEALVNELEGTKYDNAYFWTSVHYVGSSSAQSFLGLPILVKDFIADWEVVIGV
jgi:hypothetical protein